MRVVVNQQAALGPKTGIGHYTAQLLDGLRALAGPPHEIDAFPGGWMWHAGQVWWRVRRVLEAGPRGGGRRRGAWVRQRALQCLRQRGRSVVRRLFRAACARRQYDLYHEPNFIPLSCDRPTVTTIHDLSVLLHPEWHPAERVALFEQRFHHTVAHCVHFLVVSDFTRGEVIRTLNVPPERVTRVYNGIRAGLGPMPRTEVRHALRQLGVPDQYLLYLGTIEPRKNILVLLRAYCALPAAVRERWPLVLVGGWGWQTKEIADYFHREARHRGVIHLGYAPDEHLPALYNGARALVYPSLYEGFGLPPVEMMACGGAVLASTAGAVVEVVGGQAHLVPPDDIDGWRAALLRVVQDNDWWQGLRQGARRLARRFTWERCAAETFRVYATLCGSSASDARQAA